MNRILLFFVFLMSFLAHGQFTDFSFNVTTFNESCAGTGSFQFSVADVPADAVVTFYVYKLPDITVPVATTTNLSADGLDSGDYMIIASAVSAGVEVRKSINATVVDLTPALPVFHFEIQAQDCNNANQIVVVLDSGVATRYEIFDGPVTAPPQASNTFTGLLNGDYIFRVYDGCGQAISKSFNANFSPQSPSVSNPDIKESTSADCSNFTFSNTLSYPQGTIVTYPLNITYTVHLSDGSPDRISTMVISSGDLTTVALNDVTVPYIDGVTYTYDVTIVNGCGTTYNYVNSSLDPLPKLSLSPVPTPCGTFFLNAFASGFTPPYTLTFSEVPSGVSMVSYNALYPGPFSVPLVVFGGDGQPLPEGHYKATILDACNRRSQPAELDIVYVQPRVDFKGFNTGCFSTTGLFRASIPGRSIVSAVITATTAVGYPDPLPDDVSEKINSSGALTVSGLPLGSYDVTVIDNCGIPYSFTVVVPAFTPLEFEADTKTDCGLGLGSVMVHSFNQKLSEISIIAAPSGYTNPLPYDVSSSILSGNGRLYLDSLPEGSYTFKGTDLCGITDEVTIQVVGNPHDQASYVVDALCNSFNVTLRDPDTISDSPKYWLQIEDPNTPGLWRNPLNGQAYTEGDVLTTTNAIQLVNNTTNYNLSYLGTFRVLKSFVTYGNGALSKVCVNQVGDVFDYTYKVVIDNIYGIECTSDPGDVYVDASGLAPLHYYIVDANDADIVLIDNGSNPIFTNLSQATYRFKVENRCGQSAIESRDISTLPDVVDAAIPPDISVCVNAGESTDVPIDLTVQDAIIINNPVSSLYSVTYYRSNADALAEINPILDPQAFHLTSNPQTIYAKLNQVFINLCPDIVSFTVEVGAIPVLTVDEQQYLCLDIGALTLSAGSGFDSYVWAPGGETSSDIVIQQPGDYTVTVTSGSCPSSATITVLPVQQPVIERIDTFDWTSDNNGFTVVTAVPDMFVYSIDGVHYQDSNTFTGLRTGVYTVYVQDRQGCKATEKEVVLLYYPKFFTPNGDGVHETWRIEFSTKEPELMVFIYDRYGKLITSFPPQSPGWDGTLNGHPLPATDYWFVVVRQDGRVHKGHFSLIR